MASTQAEDNLLVMTVPSNLEMTASKTKCRRRGLPVCGEKGNQSKRKYFTLKVPFLTGPNSSPKCKIKGLYLYIPFTFARIRTQQTVFMS